ncbi:MAG TPA: BON domain-containing protein [Acidobacteriota bacterium]|nr:BON domain-containing protein [Acidobacteriota bacterium]
MSPDKQLSIRGIFGSEVLTPSGEAVGEIEDVVIDTDSSRILVALLSVYGAEERLFVLPWSLFSYRGEGRLAVDASRETIVAGPFVTRSEYLSSEKRDWVNQVHSYYVRSPYREEIRTARAPDGRGYKRSRMGAGWVFALVALLIIGGLIAYLVTFGDWSSPGSSLQQAAVKVRESSDNASTTARVKAAFALSKRISALDINVDTDGGIVTLTGRVPSQELKDLAELISEETSGVTEVRNRLIVDEQGSSSRMEVTQ